MDSPCISKSIIHIYCYLNARKVTRVQFKREFKLRHLCAYCIQVSCEGVYVQHVRNVYAGVQGFCGHVTVRSGGLARTRRISKYNYFSEAQRSDTLKTNQASKPLQTT